MSSGLLNELIKNFGQLGQEDFCFSDMKIRPEDFRSFFRNFCLKIDSEKKLHNSQLLGAN